ncbi:unnamed protein product, partial [Meganyctiphanes norvegica]
TEHPEPPTRLKILDKSSRSVDLSWTPPYDGNSPITRYIIEYKISNLNWYQDGERIIVDGNQNIASILDLRPATIYHLRIVARNEIGESDPSVTVTVITSKEGATDYMNFTTAIPAKVATVISAASDWREDNRCGNNYLAPNGRTSSV